jgi:hypothetical protein
MKTLNLHGLNKKLAYFSCAFLLTLSMQTVSAGVSFSYGLPGLAIGYGHHGGYFGGHRGHHFRGYHPRQRRHYFNHHANPYRYYQPRRFQRYHRGHRQHFRPRHFNRYRRW